MSDKRRLSPGADLATFGYATAAARQQDRGVAVQAGLQAKPMQKHVWVLAWA